MIGIGIIFMLYCLSTSFWLFPFPFESPLPYTIYFNPGAVLLVSAVIAVNAFFFGAGNLLSGLALIPKFKFDFLKERSPGENAAVAGFYKRLTISLLVCAVLGLLFAVIFAVGGDAGRVESVLRFGLLAFMYAAGVSAFITLPIYVRLKHANESRTKITTSKAGFPTLIAACSVLTFFLVRCCVLIVFVAALNTDAANKLTLSGVPQPDQARVVVSLISADPVGTYMGGIETYTLDRLIDVPGIVLVIFSVVFFCLACGKFVTNMSAPFALLMGVFWTSSSYLISLHVSIRDLVVISSGFSVSMTTSFYGFIIAFIFVGIFFVFRMCRPATAAEPQVADGPENAEAKQIIEETLGKSRKRRKFGRIIARISAVLAILLIAWGWWDLFRPIPLRISKETTFVSEPLTEDGKLVDYFKAIELKLYPPEIRTDDNGYRNVVRELGDLMYAHRPNPDENNPVRSRQVYEKLGLDPELRPNLEFQNEYMFAMELAKKSSPDEWNEKYDELSYKLQSCEWTLEDFPEMADWVEANGPALDVFVEGVSGKTFCIPLTHTPEEKFHLIAGLLPSVQFPREISRSIRTRLHYRKLSGDTEGVIEDMLAMQRLGRWTKRNGIMVNYLVGIAIEGHSESLDFADIPDNPVTAEQLRRLIEIRKNGLPPHTNFEDALEFERLCSLSEVENIYYAMYAWVIGMGLDFNIIIEHFNHEFDRMVAGETEFSGKNIVPEMPPSFWRSFKLTRRSRSLAMAEIYSELLIPGLAAAKEAERRNICINRMRDVLLGLLLYRAENGEFPPLFTSDPEGRPLHSWRVAILPYIGEEELYAEIRLDEPWNSEHNRQFHGRDLPIFRCPTSGANPGMSTVNGIFGEKIVIAERKEPLGWMIPDKELPLEECGSFHAGGMNYGTIGGGLHFAEKSKLADLQP